MNEQTAKIFESQLFAPIVVGVAAFGAGSLVGYILGRKTSMPDVQVNVDVPKYEEMVKEVSEKLGRTFFTEEELTSDWVPDEEPEFIMAPESTMPNPIVPETRSIWFANSTSEWNYEEEIAARTEELPYILHRDEFYGEETEYTQSTLTYYTGDDILTNQEDVPIYSREDTIGKLMFGHGSEDPNVFYIRNDRLRAEYEVLRDSGSYSVEILGLDDVDTVELELKHSAHKRFKLDED